MNTNFLKSNTITKIVALITAVFLWLFVINDGFRVDFLNAPLQVSVANITSGVSVAGGLEDVRVRVRAPLASFGSLSSEDFIASVDVSGLETGEYELPVRVTALSTDVQVVDITPKTLTVTLDDQGAVKKRVAIETRGTPGEDYALGDVEISSSEVKVSGAESVINSFDEVIGVVDVAGETNQVRRTVQLFARGVDGVELPVSIDPETVDVTVNIERQADVKSVGVQVKTTGSLPDGFVVKSISVDPNILSIQGDEDILKGISVIETDPLNLSGIIESSTVSKALSLPSDVAVFGEEIDSVQVRIEVEEVVKTKVIDITAQTTGLAPGLSAQIDPPRARLVLEGDIESLAAATDTSILVTIDLSGRSVGRFSLPVTESLVTLPGGVRLRDIQTKQFDITIE